MDLQYPVFRLMEVGSIIFEKIKNKKIKIRAMMCTGSYT